MNDGHYGPTGNACVTINDLLALPATGNEQDWEIELTDPAKLDPMIEFLDDKSLNIDDEARFDERAKKLVEKAE